VNLTFKKALLNFCPRNEVKRYICCKNVSPSVHVSVRLFVTLVIHARNGLSTKYVLHVLPDQTALVYKIY